MLSKISKTVCLDTKWKNRDIIVVEQANIPHLSKLDDVRTPVGLFKSFFVDVLIDMIIG